MLSKAVPKNRDYSPSKRINVGDAVYVRYYNAMLFKDALITGLFKPTVRGTVGWLDYEDAGYIRLVWERYAEPTITEESRIRTTGLATRESDVIEMRKFA